jgi:hypothetical protein
MKSRKIIRETMVEHQVCAEDFYGLSRLPHLVTARKDCAARLKVAGYEVSQIGRFMKRSHSTILYYLNPELRERKQNYYAKRWQTQGALKYLPEHIQAIVVEYAKATDASPRAVVSEVISSWAENEERLRKAAA